MWETRIPACERESNSLPTKVAGTANAVGSVVQAPSLVRNAADTVRAAGFAISARSTLVTPAGAGIVTGAPMVTPVPACSA